MNNIGIKYINELKSWPFKEAQQIIKKNGGITNFSPP